MTRLLAGGTHVGAAAVAALLLVAAGQPLFTDDLWWHLGLGRAYAAQGVWLAADPLLHTAAGPPAPAAWLADLLLYRLQDTLGFEALRVAHVAIVAAIVALAWVALRRASGSAAIASFGTAAFAALAAFRLFQLRPHLFTILAALLLYQLVFADKRAPSALRIGLVALLFAFWANIHNGFLLGPILLAAGLAGVVVAALLGPVEERPATRSRAIKLALCLALGGAATLLNPSGWDQYLSYFVAGVDTPSLLGVGDEWAPFRPFRFPNSPLPPAPLDWTLVWLLILAVPVAALWAARRKLADTSQNAGVDPAVIALACVCLPAMLIAVRFLWLCIFPLLLIARCASLRFGGTSSVPRAAAVALATAALVFGFLELGAWTAISRGAPRSLDRYLKTPYPAAKYYAHGTWFLKDAQVEGRLYNDYVVGGFLGFWLAPELLAFQNGTLNFPNAALEAIRAIRKRRGLEDGPGFLELLDRYEVDVFHGIRLPEQLPAGPWYYSSAHLERAPGWLLVFRNLRSSIYLRNNARNRANLESIAGYYESVAVPFDSQRGFEPERVVREARAWAIGHGMLPFNFEQLAAGTQSGLTTQRGQAMDTLASAYVALGMYEEALALDRRLLTQNPDHPRARRRRIWSLIRLDRRAEALAEADLVAAKQADASPFELQLADQARRYAALDDPEEAAALAALLPVLTPFEAQRLTALIVHPQARSAP